MNAELDQPLDFLGQEVPLGRVDKALKELWGEEDTRTKASLMNFAIYNEGATSLEANTALLEEITKEHACRGLLILALPDERPSRARAWIRAHCQIQGGKHTVCSEQVSFVLEGSNANTVRNIVFAHLDSDLPLVFWWQGDLTDNFDERLYSVIDLLFIDSSRWTDPCRDLARLADAREQGTARFRIYDLSWLRSHFIRTAIASCFQDPAALAELPKLKTVSIVHGPSHRLAALLLAAWIGVRLKAQLQVSGGAISFVLPEGQILAVQIAEGESGEPLQSVTLASENGKFSVNRVSGSTYVCSRVEIAGQAAYEQVLPGDLPTDTALIDNLLSRLGGQSLYFQMVPMLREMLQAR